MQVGTSVMMEAKSREILMPLDVSSRVGFFDRTAGSVARITSRAPFFAFCVVLVAVWLLQGVVEIIGSGWSSFTSSTYQLEINTTTKSYATTSASCEPRSGSRSTRARPRTERKRAYAERAGWTRPWECDARRA